MANAEPIDSVLAGPLPSGRIDEIARLLSRHGAVALNGARGSGRRSIAATLISQSRRQSPVRSIDANFIGDDRDYSALMALDAVDDTIAATSPDTVARAVAENIGPITFIIEHAEHADAMSLRALAIAVRRNSSIRLIITIDDTSTRLRGWRDVYGIPLVDVAPLDRDGTLGLVERLLGARPAVLDAHILTVIGNGSFRAIRWLIELSRLNDGIVIDYGRSRVRLPALAATDTVPAWALDPDLIEEPAARLIALAGSVPLSSLERLGIADRCLELEKSGVLRTRDQVVEFTIPALTYDVSGRMGEIEKRRGIEQLLANLEADEIGVLAAGTLWHRTVAAALEPSDALTARAIIDGNIRGQHAEVLRIAEHLRVVGPAQAVRLAFAAVMTGDEEAAVRWTQNATSADAIEAAGLALAVGEFRYGPNSISARALDDLIARAPAASSAVLRGYDALLRPGIRMDEQELACISSDNAVPAHTRARALRAQALRSWMDGRPVRAAEVAADADRLHRGSAADDAISLFLRASSELLRPDYDATVDVLLADIRPGDISLIRALVGLTLGLYSGAISIARMHLQTLVADGIHHDPVLDPLTWAMLSIAHSMLGDDAAAREALDCAYDASSPSLFVTAAAHHLRGIALIHLATPRRTEALAAYSAAAEASEPLDLRILFSVATYRTAMALDERRRSAALQLLSALREGDRPLDGVPGMLAELAEAFIKHDARRLIDIIGRMRRAGLLQDAKVLSVRLLSSTIMDLPARARRGITKLARHRFDTADSSGDVTLTARELEVAQLLVTRLTDREIAERLGCSPRTVSVHVGYILRKLDLPSRQEVSEALLRQKGLPV